MSTIDKVGYIYDLYSRAEAAVGSSHGSSSNTTRAPTKKVKHIDHVRTTTGYWHWYIVAGIVGICALLNIITLLRRRIQRRSAIQRASTGGKEVKRGFKKRWHAVEVLTSNFFFVRAIPIKLYQGVNLTEAIFSIAYIGVCTGLTLYRTYQNGSRRVELEFGMICYVQIPLIIALASRNNLISYLTGISYQKLNILHRAAGRACYIFAWVHTIAYCVVGLGKHGPGNRVFTTGVIALGAFTIATLSSFALARRLVYETFLVIHIIFVTLFLVGCFLHRPKKQLQPWIIAGFVIWGFDRFASLCRMAIINKVWLMPLGKKRNDQCGGCTVELVTSDVIRLSVPRPLLKWGPGQHALITMPSVAGLRYEQHPFSFANIPIEGEKNPAVFIIRAHTGFTRKLVDHIQESKTSSINCYLDGPYGNAESYTHHDSVLLIAGITHVLSHFLDIVQSHKRGKSAVRSLRLVWNIRHLQDANWILPLLDSAIQSRLSGMNIEIDVHLTRSHASDEPDMSRGLTELLANHDHPLGTDSGSTGMNSPMNEKTGSSENGESQSSGSSNTSREKLPDIEKKGVEGFPIFSPAVQEIIRFKAGRADIKQVIEDQIVRAETTMGISVCGPLSLSMDTRRAVEEVNTAQRVLDGQAKIQLSVEKFGW